MHTLIKKVIVQEKGCNLASLGQIALYVLQFLGIARFIEVQDMKVGHLVCGVNHFDLIITRIGDSTPMLREVIPIYPPPQNIPVHFV